VYWLQPPPHLRRIGAGLLVVAALVWDLRGGATEPYPVAARRIPAGTAITGADVRWLPLPAGAMAVPDLTGAITALDLRAGDPISPSAIAPTVSAPDGWWAVPIEVGGAGPGATVLLVVTDPPMTVPGLVIHAQTGDRLALDHQPALVAVPGEAAALVAAAERSGLLVAAVQP
jgi:hypothetical protein